MRLAYLVIGALAGAIFGLSYGAPVYDITEVVWIEQSTRMRMLDGIVCYQIAREKPDGYSEERQQVPGDEQSR